MDIDRKSIADLKAKIFFLENQISELKPKAEEWDVYCSVGQ